MEGQRSSGATILVSWLLEVIATEPPTVVRAGKLMLSNSVVVTDKVWTTVRSASAMKWPTMPLLSTAILREKNRR